MANKDKRRQLVCGNGMIITFDGDDWTPEELQKAAAKHSRAGQADAEWFVEVLELCPELAKVMTFAGIANGTCRFGLYHPLLHEPLGVRQYAPTYLKQWYEEKRGLADKFIAEKKWAQYLFLIEKPYRAPALAEIQDQMTDAEYWEHLSWVWTNSESNCMDKKVWKRLLSSPRPESHKMMTEDEQKFLASLPDRITVYRGFKARGRIGGRSMLSNRKGRSWTLSREKAEWFTNITFGIGLGEKKPHMVRSLSVNKSEVLAYLNDRDEQEILLRKAA